MKDTRLYLEDETELLVLSDKWKCRKITSLETLTIRLKVI